jgi:diaminopimelate decarboxylase
MATVKRSITTAARRGTAVEAFEFPAIAAPLAPSPEMADRLRGEAERLRTPLYVYDGARLDLDAEAIRRAFPDPWIRLFSLKANATPGVVARIAGAGFGANAVSRGELALAARAGVPAQASALEGIGKSPRDLRAAVELAAAGTPLLWVSLESADEAAALADLAGRLLPSRRKLDVLVRVNPAVEPETHAGLAVGRSSSKFGVAPTELTSIIRKSGGARGPLRWRGLHVHVGSQLASVESWEQALTAVTSTFSQHANGHLDAWDTLDVGGGIPAGLLGAPEPQDFARAAEQAIASVPRRGRPKRLAIEPGRALVAEAGWLVARVLHVRKRPYKGTDIIRQIVIDAGMTELVRPALYGAEHPIAALTSLGRPTAEDPVAYEAIVDGPICESTDRFGEALLPSVERGDLVAVGLAGAYASSMFSTYNGRVRPPEVLLEPDGGRTVLRPRGSLRSLP